MGDEADTDCWPMDGTATALPYVFAVRNGDVDDDDDDDPDDAGAAVLMDDERYCKSVFDELVFSLLHISHVTDATIHTKILVAFVFRKY